MWVVCTYDTIFTCYVCPLILLCVLVWMWFEIQAVHVTQCMLYYQLELCGVKSMLNIWRAKVVWFILKLPILNRQCLSTNLSALICSNAPGGFSGNICQHRLDPTRGAEMWTLLYIKYAIYTHTLEEFKTCCSGISLGSCVLIGNLFETWFLVLFENIWELFGKWWDIHGQM